MGTASLIGGGYLNYRADEIMNESAIRVAARFLSATPVISILSVVSDAIYLADHLERQFIDDGANASHLTAARGYLAKVQLELATLSESQTPRAKTKLKALTKGALDCVRLLVRDGREMAMDDDRTPGHALYEIVVEGLAKVR